MIVIYGQSNYGAVDEQGGQYAVTRFAHVYYMPLIPMTSFWMTGTERGFEIGMAWKSVLAAYARTWGLLAALVMTVTGFGGSNIVTGLLGLVIGALSISTWILWSKRRTEDAKLRGNLNALAFGTYCAPEHMKGGLRASIEMEVERRARQAESPRPPEDVARFGTRDLDELVRCYGVLSLHGRKARPTLDELLQLKAPSSDVREGIYRDNHTSFLAGDRAQMIETIEAAAAHRLPA